MFQIAFNLNIQQGCEWKENIIRWKLSLSSSLTSCPWLEGIKPAASSPISESLQKRKITLSLLIFTYSWLSPNRYNCHKSFSVFSSSPIHDCHRTATTVTKFMIIWYLDPVVGVKPEAKILKYKINNLKVFLYKIPCLIYKIFWNTSII